MALAITSSPSSVTRGAENLTLGGTDFGTNPSAITLEMGRLADDVWAPLPVNSATGTSLSFDFPLDTPLPHRESAFRFRVTVGEEAAQTDSDNVTINPPAGMDWQNVMLDIDEEGNIRQGIPDFVPADQVVYSAKTTPGEYDFYIDSSGYYAIDWAEDEPSDQSIDYFVISVGDYAVSATSTLELLAQNGGEEHMTTSVELFGNETKNKFQMETPVDLGTYAEVELKKQEAAAIVVFRAPTQVTGATNRVIASTHAADSDSFRLTIISDQIRGYWRTDPGATQVTLGTVPHGELCVYAVHCSRTLGLQQHMLNGVLAPTTIPLNESSSIRVPITLQPWFQGMELDEYDIGAMEMIIWFEDIPSVEDLLAYDPSEPFSFTETPFIHVKAEGTNGEFATQLTDQLGSNHWLHVSGDMDNSNGNRPIFLSDSPSEDVAPVMPADSVISINEGTTAVDTYAATAGTLPITYSLSGADAGLFSVDSSGSVSFNVAPDFDDPQDAGANNVYNITVTGTNSVDSDSTNVAITVLEVAEGNVPPEWTSTPDIEADAGESISTDVSAYAFDADGDDLTFAKVSGNAGLSVSSAGLVTGSISTAGTYPLVISVGDGKSEPVEGTFNIVVAEVALPNPVWQPEHPLEYFNSGGQLVPLANASDIPWAVFSAEDGGVVSGTRLASGTFATDATGNFPAIDTDDLGEVGDEIEIVIMPPGRSIVISGNVTDGNA